MPFKEKKKRAAYMRKYREREKLRKKALESAIKNGQFDVAKQILETPGAVSSTVLGRRKKK